MGVLSRTSLMVAPARVRIVGGSDHEPIGAATMNIVIFGASGALGTKVVGEGLSRGHQVTVLVRDPTRLRVDPSAVQVVTGNAHDKAVVSRVIRGADAVISALGGPPKGTAIPEQELLHHATRTIVDAMTEQGIARLVYVSAWGVGDSRSHTTLTFR